MPLGNDRSGQEHRSDESAERTFDTLTDALFYLQSKGKESATPYYIVRSPEGKFLIYLLTEDFSQLPPSYTFVGYFKISSASN